ncbi:repetitive organellar protein-like [Prorops nasuta]|uniref:repetitive organellar protein-like n=1 Tax=Prorops nasuta TaxID=863751 RepID=UPI0034CE6F37
MPIRLEMRLWEKSRESKRRRKRDVRKGGVERWDEGKEKDMREMLEGWKWRESRCEELREEIKGKVGEVELEIGEREGEVRREAGWFDSECRECKRRLIGEVKKWRRGELEREGYIKGKKEYRELCERKREERSEEFKKEIEGIKTEGEIWKLLRRLRVKEERREDGIDIEKWRDHFMRLLGDNETSRYIDNLDEGSIIDRENAKEKCNEKTFIVPRKFWKEFWNNGNKLKVGWTDDFNEYFQKVNELCFSPISPPYEDYEIAVSTIERKNEDFEISISSLSDLTSENTLDYDIDPEFLNISCDDYKEDNTNDTLRAQSPFYKDFFKIYENILAAKNSTNESNPYYSQSFVIYLLNYIMPFYSMWSAMVIFELNLLRDSNAPIENYFKILKENLFNKEKKVIVPRFIQRSEELLEGRLRNFNCDLRTTRQRKNCANILNNIETAEEIWKRKSTRNASKNSYFKVPNYVSSKQIENKENIQKEVNDENNVKKKINVFNTEDGDDSDYNKEQAISTRNMEVKILPSYVNLFDNDLKYPEHFPNINTNIAGIILDHNSFSTLIDNKWLDDTIINSFFSILKSYAPEKITTIETFLTEMLLKGRISRDIPYQCDEFGKISGNCRVHVCVWGYIVSTGLNIIFKDTDLKQARKSIAKIIYEANVSTSLEVEITNNRKIFIEGDLIVEKEKPHKIINLKSLPIPTIDYCSNLLTQIP